MVEHANAYVSCHVSLSIELEISIFLPRFIFRPKIGYVYYTLSKGRLRFGRLLLLERMFQSNKYTSKQQLMCDINEEIMLL